VKTKKSRVGDGGERREGVTSFMNREMQVQNRDVRRRRDGS